MIKHYRAYNINWDTDNEDVELPTEVFFDADSDIDVSAEGANIISDKHGWCINSFDFEELPKMKQMKLETISGVLYECKEQLSVLGDAAEDDGNEHQLKYIDQLISDVNEARSAIQNGNVIIEETP